MERIEKLFPRYDKAGQELIKKAYADSEVSGKCYEAIVEAVEKIYKSMEQSGKQK